jgi:hypothetical protein
LTLPEWIEGGYVSIEVTPIYDDQKEDVEKFKQGDKFPPHEMQNVLEALLCDLCSKGKLEEGEHLIECID